MAGKKMRSRKNNCHNQKYLKYKSEGKLQKSKKRKQEKHQLKVLEQTNRSEERLQLLQEVMETQKLNTYQMKRKFGTLNIHRLLDIKNCVYLDSDWYKERQKAIEDRKHVQGKVHQSNPVMYMPKGRKKAKKVPSRSKS